MSEPTVNTPAVRVRFAPSPTGMLHLGGARTALVNHLFARHHGGSSVLRIEDTDRARSERRYEETLLHDLDWLGLRFDEGPVRQSERQEAYERAAGRLLEDGRAYYSSDEAGRRALYLRPEVREGFVRDALRGEVSFGGVEDFVLMKSDGSPGYNFAAAVDDLAMGITHIIRGEEHIPNSGRQALVYRALGAETPEFVHLGVILGPDGGKLSKRHGARSVADYREEGYLPQAVLNYLALLGWSHPEGREEFESLGALEREWDPRRLGPGPASFDPDRLRWTNARRIRELPADALWRLVEPFVPEETVPERREIIAQTIQSELGVLSDAPRLIEEVTGPVEPEEFARDLPEVGHTVYTHTTQALHEREREFGPEAAREFVGELRGWAKERGIKTRDLLHPLRLALTGRESGPEMPLLFAALGGEESARRIAAAREAIVRVRER